MGGVYLWLITNVLLRITTTKLIYHEEDLVDCGSSVRICKLL